MDRWVNIRVNKKRQGGQVGKRQSKQVQTAVDRWVKMTVNKKRLHWTGG